MARDWIDKGLRHSRERAEELRLASERRQHHVSLIKEQGPHVMRELLAEVRAVVDEYSQKAGTGAKDIKFEELPHEGFCVVSDVGHRLELQCRPSYEEQVVYCNLTRTDVQQTEPVERVFNLNFTVDDPDRVELREGNRVFRTVDDAVEFLMAPVLFPAISD